jgi:hypothetical protein
VAVGFSPDQVGPLGNNTPASLRATLEDPNCSPGLTVKSLDLNRSECAPDVARHKSLTARRQLQADCLQGLVSKRVERPVETSR